MSAPISAGDPQVYVRRWLFGETPAAPSFDSSLMAAMNWPWPVAYNLPVQIVASGMTPSDQVPI